MYIHGSFMNRAGEEITVYILTKQSRTEEKEIGTDESGLYFTDDPVEITSEMNDTFDVLLTQSATVRLLAREYIEDFFCSTCRDAVVNIYRGGKCLFAGFIEPQAYSQNYNDALDEIELSCIDALSALQYSNYKNIGTATMPYATAKAKATERTFRDILKEILDGVAADVSITGESPTYLYDASRAIDSSNPHAGTILQDLSISDLLFLGDEEDDVWTQDTVAEEILRFLNLHITQEGMTFYVFAWETVKSGETIAWRELFTGESLTETTRKTVDITPSVVADTDTQISVGEVYNQLLLTCDTKSVESLIESPLDDDLLEPAFNGYQLYAKEISRPDPGQNCYKAFRKMIFGDTSRVNAKGYIRDWYIEVMRNSQWRFPSNGETGNIYNTYCSTGNNQQGLLNLLASSDGYAAIVGFHSEEAKEEDRGKSNAPTAHFSLNNYLIIPVGGNGKDTESNAYPTESSLLRRAPRAIYTGATSGGVLSPADEETTNYIVLSGKLLLCPLLEQTNLYSYLHDTFTWPDYCKYEGNGANMGTPYDIVTDRDDFKIVKFQDGERLYTREYFKAATPQTEATYDSNDANRINILPVEDGEAKFEFKYSSIGESDDHISKVAVIACMLQIGDKCVVETGTDGQPSDFTWQTYKERSECADDDEYYSQCFFIGFDPDKGDKLIGSSFDFQNNISHTMNIDAEGIAIPIKQSDKVSGQVRFKILGPVNVMWDEITRRHKTWFRHTKWTSTAKPLMAFVSSILIEQFEIKVYSDNGKLSAIGDNDIVYISDTDEAFINKKDDITFKINSALTADERQSLGVSAEVSLSTPKNATTDNAVLNIYDRTQSLQAKSEQLYVDAYYTEYHTPHVEMEQNFQESKAAVSLFNHYYHAAMGKTFFVEGITRTLIDDEAKVKMKEC